MHEKAPTPQRSALMARIGPRNTKPEILVRRAAHRLGYRFRLYRADLPGTPDLVFPSRRVVIFVHGCFWHRHRGCSRCTAPKTRSAYWQAKFDANEARDARQIAELRELGWRVYVIWECEALDPAALEDLLRTHLK